MRREDLIKDCIYIYGDYIFKYYKIKNNIIYCDGYLKNNKFITGKNMFLNILNIDKIYLASPEATNYFNKMNPEKELNISNNYPIF